MAADCRNSTPGLRIKTRASHDRAAYSVAWSGRLCEQLVQNEFLVLRRRPAALTQGIRRGMECRALTGKKTEIRHRRLNRLQQVIDLIVGLQVVDLVVVRVLEIAVGHEPIRSVAARQ